MPRIASPSGRARATNSFDPVIDPRDEAIAHDVRLRQYGGQIRTEQYWLYLARR